jgi:hypothetical protein
MMDMRYEDGRIIILSSLRIDDHRLEVLMRSEIYHIDMRTAVRTLKDKTGTWDT